MPKIVVEGGDGLHETWYLFIELCFEYCLERFEIDIASGVVFFGALGAGIYAEMIAMMLQSSLDEELDMESIILLIGVSIFPIAGILVLFVPATVSAL